MLSNNWMTYECQAAFLKQFYSEFVRRGPVANGVAWFIADSAKFSGNKMRELVR